MSGNRFQFKRFTVEQENCAMKVGTDGVLLGAWCRIEPTDKAILDIGTGTGVIALQLAQRIGDMNAINDAGTRTEEKSGIGATIEAVEIDSASAAQARRNFDASRWRDCIKLHAISAQEFAYSQTFASKFTPQTPVASPASFDHIVSNPPYFTGALASPDPSRNTARHTDSFSREELIDVCDKLLKPDGRISLILPAGLESNIMITTAEARGFVVSRLTEVRSTPRNGVKRILLELLRDDSYEDADTLATPELATSRRSLAPKTSSLIIEDADPGTFSAEYRALTRDFYLHF